MVSQTIDSFRNTFHVLSIVTVKGMNTWPFNLQSSGPDRKYLVLEHEMVVGVAWGVSE